MQNITIETKEAKKLVKDLAKVAYPGYTGRKFKVCVEKTYYMQNYWDGGSRNYCVAVDLSSGKVVEPSPDTTTPWNACANTSFAIPPGVGILERSIFCGKEMGIRLYVGPQSIAAVEPQKAIPGTSP
jgi:hypothetical protein